MAAEQVYSAAEIQHKLAQELPDWYLEDGWLHRHYTTDGWRTTMMVVNAIGYLAEAANHHPDLEVAWAKVGIKLQTHSAGGITDKDFELARKLEAVVLWRPENASIVEGGTSGTWVRSGGKPS